MAVKSPADIPGAADYRLARPDFCARAETDAASLVSKLVVGSRKVADVRHAAGHDDVATKFSLVPFRDEDPTVVRYRTRKRMLINFQRRPVIIAILIFALEPV